MPTPPLPSRDDDEHGAHGEVEPVAWGLFDKYGLTDHYETERDALERADAAEKDRPRNGPYTVSALYAADVPALMALLKKARDLLDRIEEAQAFDPTTGETTIYPGEVMDDIVPTVDSIGALLREDA